METEYVTPTSKNPWEYQGDIKFLVLNYVGVQAKYLKLY